MKKLTKTLLTAVVFMASATLVMAQQKILEGTGWQLFSDGHLIISSNAACTDWREIGSKINIAGGKNATEFATKITISEGVTTIASSTFRNCINVLSVSFPTSLTSIGTSGFSGCVSLKKMHYQEALQFPEQFTSLGNSAFSGCTALNIVIIPAALTSIGQDAFRNCSGLTMIMLDQNSQLKTISTRAFDGCSKLTDFGFIAGFPATVTRIDGAAFRGTYLPHISFPENSQLEVIGGSAFENCDNLQLVRLPATVTQIGNNAFYDCDILRTVTFDGSKPTLGVKALSTQPVIRVPCGDISWDGFVNEEVFEESGSSITGRNRIERYGCPALEGFKVKWSDAIIDEEAKTITIDNLVTDQNDCMEVYFGMSEEFNADNYELYLEGDNNVSTQLGTMYDDRWGTGWHEYVCFTDVSGWEGTLYIVQKNSAPLAAKMGVQRAASGSIVEGLNVVTTYSVSIGSNSVSTGSTPDKVLTEPKAYYNVLGVQLSEEPEKGVYIILYDNGTAEKRVR